MDQDELSSRRGIRVEPKFLRDPTSLESISSGLTWLSLYVSSTMPKKHRLDDAQHYPQPSYHTHRNSIDIDHEENPNHRVHNESVTFATFQEINDKPSSAYLLLGYSDGFQLWDVTNPENVHETCSIRDDSRLGKVEFMHILAHPEKEDDFPNERPLLAVVVSPRDSMKTHSSNKEPSATVLHIYSLQTHRVVKSFQYLTEHVRTIQSNERFVILGCTTVAGKTTPEKQSEPGAAIRILASGNLTDTCAPLADDVAYRPGTGPVFTLGSRYLAYATSAEVSPKAPDHRHPTNNFLASVISSDKDMMKEAARGIAKGVVNGVRSLGSYGYQSLSNYFSAELSRFDESALQQHRPAAPTGSIEAGTNNHPPQQSTLPAAGMVMVRDLLVVAAAETGDGGGGGGADKTNKKKTSSSLSPSVYGHTRPHTHPISSLVFNSAGTMLLSASNQGHTFQVFSLVDGDGLALMYKLSRGITDALVSDVQFSADSLWCAVSTVKGTTHLYAINPYGGHPEIWGHVQSKVTNRKYSPFGTRKEKPQIVSLGSVERIKQRRPMPTTRGNDPTTPPTQDASSTTRPVPLPSLLFPTSNSIDTSRPRLTTLFLPVRKVPSLVDQLQQPPSTTTKTRSLSAAAAATTSSSPWWRHHATHLTSILPTFAAGKQYRHDESQVFGFEEEEDMDGQPVAIGHRDMYSIRPDGVLTLHRYWTTQVLVKKRDQGRTIEKYYEMHVEANDIAEWQVARQLAWPEVKGDVRVADKHKTSTRHPIIAVAAAATMTDGDSDDDDHARTMTTANNNKRGWLAFAEIATYCPEYELPIWQAPHISMHTFDPDLPNLEQQMWEGMVPSATQIMVRRDVPEPYTSRIDRVNKTNAAVHAGSVKGVGDDEHLDDALVELEENLSNAMSTSFSPSSKTAYFSTSLSSPVLMQFSPSSPTSLDTIANDPATLLSFEDACHVHLGSGGDQYLKQRSASPFSVLDDESSLIPEEEEGEEEEEEMGEALFSPDGDNEIASPYDSVFGNPEFSSVR